MNNDLDKLLINLEPIINNKCIEIKKNKEQKKQNVILILLCLSFIIIPSVLILLNISIVYFMIGIILIITTRFFIKLPDILKKNLEVTCYE